MDFDGVDDHVNLGNLPVNRLSALTIEAWVKFNSLRDASHIFGKMGTNNEDIIFTSGALVYGDTNDLLVWMGEDSGPSAARAFTTSDVIVPGVWMHAAFVFDGTGFDNASRMKIYVNGVQQGVTFTGTFPTQTPITTEDAILGAMRATQNHMNGQLNEIRIWTVARTQAQIQENINRGVSRQPGLLAYYKFNQGIAGADNVGVTTLIDDSGNAHNGILNNFALSGETSNWVGTPEPDITLTPHPDNPALKYCATHWYDNCDFDAARVFSPVVSKVNGMYYMYYTGEYHWNPFQIGLATSTDGLTWTKNPLNPVIENNTQNWCTFRESPRSVLFEDNRFKMWFFGDNQNLNAIWQAGYSTSSDGYNWTLLDSNPVIHDPSGIWLSGVTKFQGQYYAYYSYGYGNDTTVHYATSYDGINFTEKGIIQTSGMSLNTTAIDGNAMTAVITHQYQTSEFIFSIWYVNGSSYYGYSTDGFNFKIHSTPILNHQTYWGITSVLIENGNMKFWGDHYDGNLTWDYGNFSIWHYTAPEPDWGFIFQTTTEDLYDIRPSAYPIPFPQTLNRLTNVTTITRRIAIKNFGTGSISNVKATMSSIPAGVTVIDGSVSWAGTLAPGGEATGGDTFAYSYKRGTSVDLTAITWDFEFTDEHGVARVLRNVRQ